MIENVFGGTLSLNHSFGSLVNFVSTTAVNSLGSLLWRVGH